jgi:hypothetical protein
VNSCSAGAKFGYYTIHLMVIKSICSSLCTITLSLLHVELCCLRSGQQLHWQCLKLKLGWVHVKSAQRSAWRVAWGSTTLVLSREAMQALVQGQQVGHRLWLQGW